MSLKLKLTSLFAFIAFMISAIFTAGGLFLLELHNDKYERNTLLGVQSIWQQISNNHILKLEQSIKEISRNNALLEAIKNKKSDIIDENTRYISNRMTVSDLIKAVNHYDLSLNILNKKTKLEDDFNSPIIKDIIESKKFRSGYIKSSSGQFYLLYGFPVYYQGELLSVSLFIAELQPLLVKAENYLQSGATITESSVDAHVQKEYSADKIFEITKTPVVGYDGTIIGSLVSKKDLTQVLSKEDFVQNIIILVSFICVLLVTGLVFLYLVHSFKPLSMIIEDMRNITAEKFNISIHGINRQDEIGDIAKAVSIFRDKSIEREIFQKEAEKEAHLKLRRHQYIEGVIQTFRETIAEKLASMQRNADIMGSTSDLLTENIKTSAGKAREAIDAVGSSSRHVQSVSSASGQLAGSIQEISKQISATTDIVGKANQAAKASDDKVSSLANAAQKIGDVISIIREIAEQTNLLALNATIESARAGEAGRGFAVVASEVKELATQTAKATQEIEMQISNIQNETCEAVQAIQQIAQIMKDVNNNTASIAAAVEQQGASTTEISRSISHAASGTEIVINNMSSMSSMAGETEQSAEQMNMILTGFTKEAQDLNDIIKTFIDDVVAA